MTKAEANEQAKLILEWRNKEAERIKQEAKENGTWQEYGFDSNNHLFKELDTETKKKLKRLKSSIDEQ